MGKNPALGKKIYVFDIEGNNLYDGITNIWCMWIYDVISGDKWGFGPNQIEESIEKLKEADVVVGHNVIDFDLCAIAKLYPQLMVHKFRVLDTLCLSRYLKPDRVGDSPEYPEGHPFRGPTNHSLKAWGVFLGFYKGEYGEQEAAWGAYTDEMFDYCEQDVALTLKLFFYLCELSGFDPHNPPTINWTKQ